MFDSLCLQTIPKKAAQLCLEVERFIHKELALPATNTTFIVGFSGGADSTALLVILKLLAPRLGMRLIAAHLNHQIRSEAQEEALHCASLCRELKIPFHTHQVNIPLACINGSSMEETARNARYNFFATLLKKTPNARLALGHQLNDLGEDVLMRLIRGAGWPALAGMPARDDARLLCRPLLLTPRKKLEWFLKTLGITYVNDPSNNEQAYFRNRVRHEILPLFLKENPNFLTKIADLWRLGTLDEELFSTLITHESSLSAPFLIPQSQLLDLSRPLRLRLYKKRLEKLHTHPLAKNLMSLDDAWGKKQRGKTIQFPRNVCAHVEKEGIRLIKK